MKIPFSTRPKYPVLVVAGLGGLFTVVNLAFAQTWTPASEPGRPLSPIGWVYGRWVSVASSADGIKLVAARQGHVGYGTDYPLPIYTSADSGMTWTPTSAPNNVWSSVGSSDDGTKLVAVATLSVVSDGLIYTSTNSGATWTPTSAPSNSWSCVASSADGTRSVAATSYGPIYTSPDSGATWAQTSAPNNSWSSV